jgi:dTDP-4-amino-4,6-dideoxygalactose transaminase
VRKEFLVFGNPLIEEPEIREVESVLRSGWLGTGPRVSQFQRDFAAYVGAKHALALNSCTAALHLSMLVSGVGPGDEVLTTPLTFAATANSILHTGATPRFVDVKRETQNIDETLIEAALTPNVKALLPVHFAGRPCDMDALCAIAKRNGLVLIEDAAHAIEAEHHGRKIGAIGDLTCFSFYVTKNIVTGEGGMITTNRDDLAEKIAVLGLHGLSQGAWERFSDKGFKHYEVLYPGYKYNMMDIQAAIGIHQLKRIDAHLLRRREIWARYNQAFAKLPLITPTDPEPNTLHSLHLYTPLLDIDNAKLTRDEFQQKLHEMNIGTGIHYVSLHLHKYYRERFGFKPHDFPNALYISERTISLPLSPKLTDEDVQSVIDAVKTCLE